MPRFLKRVQGLLATECAGRYLAFLLHELATSEPDAFVSIIKASGAKHDRSITAAKLQSGDYRVEVEWTLPRVAGQKIRRADLAIVDSVGEPVLLIEIKEEDGKKSNTAQI
jgi:hypothetical protein